MQRQAETIGKRWDYCADGYDAIVQNEFAEELAEKWSEILKNHAPCEKGKVLDIGTGPGFFAVLMGRMGWQVTGIDCSEKWLRQQLEMREKRESMRNFIRWTTTSWTSRRILLIISSVGM